jgi:quercetin dioxygenase-like cupin family protein
MPARVTGVGNGCHTPSREQECASRAWNLLRSASYPGIMTEVAVTGVTRVTGATPNAYPPQKAVLVGEPSQVGPYVIRVKVPSGVKLMPHRHPEDRIYTVMSGVFYIGLGDQFDGDKVKAYPPGSVIVLPGDTWHFHWAKSGEYVTQVTAIGPLGLEYRDAKNDPREQKRA